MAAPSPEQRALLERAADTIAEKEGVSPKLLRLMVTQESGWNPSAVNPETQATGLGQIIPATWKAYADPGWSPKDPIANLTTMARYQKVLQQRYHDPIAIVGAYHAGETIWDQWAKVGKSPGPKTQQHIQDVFRRLHTVGPDPSSPDAAAVTPVAATPPPATAEAPGEDALPLIDPTAVEAQIQARPSLGAQFASGLPEGAIGVADLPGAVLGATGPLRPIPSVAAHTAPYLQPYLAAQPESFVERIARSAGRGVGATIALAPVLMAGGVPAMVALGIGALRAGITSGVGAETAGSIAETVGLPRTPFEVAGGMAGPLAGLGYRVATGTKAARLATEATVAQQKLAIQVANEARKADLANVRATTADVMADTRHGAAVTLAETRRQTQALVKETRDLGAAQVTQATVQGAARVSRAEEVAAGARALTTAQEAVTARTLEHLLVQQDPDVRAKALGAILRNNYGSAVATNSEHYTSFYDSMVRRGVRAPLPHITETASELTQIAQGAGLAPDAAAAAANRILALAAGEAGATDLSIEAAGALRAELRALRGRASGPLAHRAGVLQASVDRQITQALPDEAARATWDALRAERTVQARVFENRLVERMLDNSPSGQATADSLAGKFLAQPWKPEHFGEVDQLLNAAGTQTVARRVIEDSLIRKLHAQATDEAGHTNWGAFRQQITNREATAPIFERVMPDPRRRQVVLRMAQDAEEGQIHLQTATERVAIEAAAARQLRTDAEEAARVGTQAAQQRAGRQREWVQADMRQRIHEVGRAGRAAAHEVWQQRRGELRSLKAAKQAAEARLPSTSPHRRVSFTQLPVTVLDTFLAGLGYSVAGGPGMVLGAGVRLGVQEGAGVIEWLRQPQNRAFMREAARTAADSAAGRRLLRGAAVGVAATRFGPQTPTSAPAPRPVLGPQAVEAAPPAQVQATP